MEVNPNSPQSNGSSVVPTALGNVQRPGEYLRQVRIAQKRELSEVVKDLNIPVKTLTALEQDDYKALPEATFIKGYYRTYAKYLKVDASSIIQRFDEIYQNDTGLLPNHALNNSPIKIMGKLPGSKSDRNKKWLKRILVTLAVLVAIAVAVMAIQNWSSSTESDSQEVAPAESDVQVLNLDNSTAVSGDQLELAFSHPTYLDSAKRALDQALEVDSRDSTANMMMGVLLQQEGSKISMDKAESYFKRAISADPKNAQARNNYGTYLYQIERYNDALQQLNVAGATLGYDQRYRALENAGRIYLKLGDVSNAEKTFKQALQVNRDSYVSMLELSEIFYAKQQTAAATQLYEQFVRSVGQKNQGARALWIGIRIARANSDTMGTQVLVNQLRALFPESPEYQRYLQLQYSTEAVWK
jgi:type IV pilus assembly protein PilF